MSDPFDDIKSMLSQIMLGTSSGISKRIKTMTAVKRRTTNHTVIKCIATDQEIDMSFDEIKNNSNEAIEFEQEKNHTQTKSISPAVLK
jgi:hypothetical protein